ncbi:hypothetical protein L6164_015360 [Bauhinia variegata]|uniref:Uncharacterized protein n=1 Tax=Bauhinia variegata TaxID=167791 RepID=A0ACB9NK33_BAUVA|nr:hypothetical protein L6164_015360 [Bauhinia variegata]
MRCMVNSIASLLADERDMNDETTITLPGALNSSGELESDPKCCRCLLVLAVGHNHSLLSLIAHRRQQHQMQKLGLVIGEVNITNSSSYWLRKKMKLHRAT